MKEYIAFDIGGTHIKYGIVSETGTVLGVPPAFRKKPR